MRFLVPMAEYQVSSSLKSLPSGQVETCWPFQEFVSTLASTNLLGLIIPFIRVRETKDARLAFEALKLLASMFVHKKYAMEFIFGNNGLTVSSVFFNPCAVQDPMVFFQLLMDIPRPSIAATGSTLVLYYFSCTNDAMEKLCATYPGSVKTVVE